MAQSTMQQRWLFAMFIVISIATTNASAFDSTVRIELVTCTPDGIMNAWKERYDPKRFWINQNVIFEMAVERYQGSSAAADCAHVDAGVDRRSCVSHWENRRASIIKCFQTTGRMCRAHGGLC